MNEIEAFAEAARRVGHADPADVDDYLRQGSQAFLGKNYAAALRIFRALLIPVAGADIDLGQHKTLDEVLSVDLAACAAQYVACMYMTAAPPRRGQAVLSAIDATRGVGHFWEPLRELEHAAIEPLPAFDSFLAQWRALVEQRAAKPRDTPWDRDEDRWLREAVRRAQGPAGLACPAARARRAPHGGR